jgi:hypothetical protein
MLKLFHVPAHIAVATFRMSNGGGKEVDHYIDLTIKVWGMVLWVLLSRRNAGGKGFLMMQNVKHFLRSRNLLIIYGTRKASA